MIGDFQLHHTVLRRYYKHRELLTDPYYMEISDDFKTYCKQRDYSPITVGHYVKQSERFMNYLVSREIRDCHNITLAIINGYIRTLAGYTYKTVEQNICSIRAFLRYLVLPVDYFHVFFTIPQELNTLVLQNQKLLYSILIKSAGHTLMELASDPKFLGATIGVTSVLHTWGQNLSFHPHVHCIVPGGGLSNNCLRFVRSSKKFFIPVRVISKKFRG
ncbi:MAG: transposase [Desulfitobacteriaceae bacterium]|nr:transposase [Desulfitobacteriaceae bacterium]